MKIGFRGLYRRFSIVSQVVGRGKDADSGMVMIPEHPVDDGSIMDLIDGI